MDGRTHGRHASPTVQNSFQVRQVYFENFEEDFLIEDTIYFHILLLKEVY